MSGLSLWGVIIRSVLLLRKNFILIYKIAFVCYIPLIFFVIVSNEFFPYLLNIAVNTQSNAVNFLRAFLPSSLILYLIISPPINGAAIKIVSDTYAGLDIHINKIIRVIQKFGVRMLLVSLLQIMLLLPAYLFLAVPGIYLTVSWCLYNAAIVVEGKGVIDCLGRSWDLTTGYRFEIFFTLVIVGVISCGIVKMIALLLESLTPENTNIEIISVIIPYFILVPFVRILEAVIYFNIRIQKEHLNQRELSLDLGEEDNIELRRFALGESI